MTGGFSFKLTSKRVEYKFNVNRKITRITGDSATGKSELIRILSRDADTYRKTTIICPHKYQVINDSFFNAIRMGFSNTRNRTKNHNSLAFINELRDYLSQWDNTLFFADEDFKGMGTDEFATFCKFTDSFFVLFCRNPLHKLPYSYTEIYTMRTSGKFHELIPVFKGEDFLKFYENRKIIVEDSNSGYEFFNHFYDDVISAEGKSKIKKLLGKTNSEIVADGAAFGCEIEAIMEEISLRKLDTKLFLPESFEYLLLASELFKKDIVDADVLDPMHKITGLYFSWENYFTELLMGATKNLANNYTKSTLNECYYKPCCCKNGKACNIEQTTKKKEAVLGKYLEVKNNESAVFAFPASL